MRWRIEPSTIAGSLQLPGDKSIAHRALMLSALAGEPSTITNLPDGEDVHTTARCLRELAVDIDANGDTVIVTPPERLAAPSHHLDAGNSGTTMRLLAGILAGQPFSSSLTGDASLSRRPMGRVVEPLARMGARIDTTDGRAPLSIHGGDLRGIRYLLPVASAQVKSAILLAGLFAQGETSIIEPVPTRDHTERMFLSLGISVHRKGHEVTLRPGRPKPFTLRVPGDPSSAAFFFTGAVLTGGSVRIQNMNVNPTRTGFLRALERMGATIQMEREREDLGEPMADVEVRDSATRPITVDANEVPALVDEIPLLALLATQANGTSIIRGAAELRVKETDRIATVTEVLNALGGNIEPLADGFVVRGPTPLHGATVNSHGDHRLAMMLAVGGAIAHGPTIVQDAEAAAVSFPGFATAFASTGGRIESR